MVTGLDVFQKAFAPYQDQYVLIGGTAAFLTMQEVGLDFRATKDLDLVLHIEVLSKEFGQAIWQFVRDAGYEFQQISATDRPRFYRFTKPSNAAYPTMLELFSRAPDALVPAQGSVLTPIPMDEAVSSLSAILLDEDYYRFIIDGRRMLNGLTWIGEDRLIPLKAIAWLDLTTRKSKGEPIDRRNIRKHCNDVIRLSSLLTPDTRIEISPKIQTDLRSFIEAVKNDETVDPEQVGVKNTTLTELLQRLDASYFVNPTGFQGGPNH